VASDAIPGQHVRVRVEPDRDRRVGRRAERHGRSGVARGSSQRHGVGRVVPDSGRRQEGPGRGGWVPRRPARRAVGSKDVQRQADEVRRLSQHTASSEAIPRCRRAQGGGHFGPDKQRWVWALAELSVI